MDVHIMMLSSLADGWSVLDHLFLLELEVANCGLSGPLPSPLYYINNGVNGYDSSGSPLRRLQLQGNSLTGSIPQTWSALQRLACLQLHNNPGLCGDVPDGLPCFPTTGTSLGEHVIHLYCNSQCEPGTSFSPRLHC